MLTSLREQQQIERDLLSAKLELITFRISLYRALAGGFETPHEIGESTDEPYDGDETLG